MEDDNIESLRKPVGITKPKCRLMLICQPTNNHITEYTGIALKRNVPPFMRTASKPKHVRKRKRRCYFQNCTNTSDNCEIINHGCSLHRNEVRIRNNTLRRNNFAKHKALKNANQDFATDNYLKNVNYMKTVSFLDDYVTPAAVEKGKLIGLTSTMTLPYMCFKKFGVAFLPNCVDIDNESYNKFKDYCKGKKSMFQ